MKYSHYPLLFLLLLLSIPQVHGQSPNFSEDVAPILYNHCTSCHRTGGIAPFRIESYNDAAVFATDIALNVSNGNMPPWPPDTTYSRFAHERILSGQQVQTITDWVLAGSPQGDPNLEPPLPTFPVGSEIGTPDLSLTIPMHTSNATTADEYICFYLPTGLNVDKKIRAIEIIPGNRAIVHHVLAYLDPTNTIPVGGECNVGATNAKLMTGYVPGGGPTVFPNGQNVKMGMDLPANSTIALQIHYPAGSAGQTDQTVINFFFYPDGTNGVRQVFADAVLQNWALFIPPDTFTQFTAQYPAGNNGLPANISLLSVFPHMHLLGKSIESHAITPANDTLPLVRINDWDFEWQGFYSFRRIVKLPTGTQLHATALYDNTSLNHHNPHNPPQWVFAGEETTDEMFLVYMHYTLYFPGDELLDLDSLLDVPVGIQTPLPGNIGLKAFPNPLNSTTTIELTLQSPSQLRLELYDVNGKQVRGLADQPLPAGKFRFEWDGDNASGQPAPTGMYLLRARVDNEVITQKLMLMR